jgi:hypothetical protein
MPCTRVMQPCDGKQHNLHAFRHICTAYRESRRHEPKHHLRLVGPVVHNLCNLNTNEAKHNQLHRVIYNKETCHLEPQMRLDPMHALLSSEHA